MKIWIDILTPKQLLFFEPMIKNLEKENELLCTTRRYREANRLAELRDIHPTIVGKHGGGDNFQKLRSSSNRVHKLSTPIKKFSPDLVISFCSPEAARVSHGLGIRHIAFSNSPHAHAAMKLSVPLVQKLLIPKHIPKSEFSRYGISPKDIIQYNAMDEYVVIRGGSYSSFASEMDLPKPKTILIRTHESKAAYFRPGVVDVIQIIQKVASTFSDCNIIVLGRYYDEISFLKKQFGNKVTVLDKVVDSAEILSRCDALVGSGGTMTSEAVLRGIPAVSYNAVPNRDEEYLVKKRLLKKTRDPDEIVRIVRQFLDSDMTRFKQNAKQLLDSMEDPYLTLKATIKEMENSESG